MDWISRVSWRALYSESRKNRAHILVNPSFRDFQLKKNFLKHSFRVSENTTFRKYEENPSDCLNGLAIFVSIAKQRAYQLVMNAKFMAHMLNKYGTLWSGMVEGHWADKDGLMQWSFHQPWCRSRCQSVSVLKLVLLSKGKSGKCFRELTYFPRDISSQSNPSISHYDTFDWCRFS